MPSAAVLAPVVLPLVAGVVIAVFGFAGMSLGRVAAAIGAWSAVAALLAVWIPVRSSLELTLGSLGYGSSFDLRIDAVTFAFGLMIATPTAVLLTLQPRTWQETCISLLGLASAIAAIEGGSVVLTAIGGGTAATVAIVLLETEDPRAPRPSWATLLAGWLALSWVGVMLQVGGGTAVYSAVPVATVTAPLFAVLGGFALAAISIGTALGLVAGLVLLATAAAMVACLALLPDRAGLAAIVSIAAAVGLPPGLAFGARVIGIEATFEAGDFLGLIGVGAAAAWAVLMVGGARAIGLPGGRGHPATAAFAGVSMGIALLTLFVGPAIAAVQTGFANPVATEVMSTAALGGGLTAVVTVSSVLPAVTP